MMENKLTEEKQKVGNGGGTYHARQERDFLRGMGSGGKQHSVGKEQTSNYLGRYALPNPLTGVTLVFLLFYFFMLSRLKSSLDGESSFSRRQPDTGPPSPPYLHVF